MDIINILIDKIAEHECKTVIRPKFLYLGQEELQAFLEEINSMFKAAQIIFQGKIHYGIKPGMKKQLENKFMGLKVVGVNEKKHIGVA